MSTERHSTGVVRLVKALLDEIGKLLDRIRVVPTGIQPGCVIPFNEVYRRLGLTKSVCAAWKYNERKNPDGIRVYRECSNKEFVFSDDLIEFLRDRWSRQRE